MFTTMEARRLAVELDCVLRGKRVDRADREAIQWLRDNVWNHVFAVLDDTDKVTSDEAGAIAQECSDAVTRTLVDVWSIEAS